MTNNVILSVENLRVYFLGHEGVARAVDDVSYQVGRGETVCLVGESGCGKTVSALAVLGLIPKPPGEIPGGRVLFGGANLLDFDEEQLREIRGSRIAMVFQEPLTSLNPVFTIGDQIGEAITAHESVEEGVLRQRSIDLLHDVGISSPEERLHDYPHQLSGGQRQRVMIAMALACGPDLVIADEPTTALDVTIQAQILKVFRALQNTRSMSLLYITHDLRVVADIADQVYVMYAGTIVEQGQRDHVFHHPQHPYTQALLASLPDRSKRGKELYSIPGSVPSPLRKPSGCPFHPRCSYAISACQEKKPGMCDYSEGHLARCPVLYKRRA